MDIDSIRAFFMWCTILNMGLLILSSLMCSCGKGWVWGIHNRWFSISRETFNVAIYSFLGLYKIFIFVFNLIPYVALLIIG